MRDLDKHSTSRIRVHGEEEQRQLHPLAHANKINMPREQHIAQAQSHMTDFEPALQDSIQIVFDGVQIKGCWFHYTQCLLRYLKGLILNLNLNFCFFSLLILLCFKVLVTKLSMKITWHSGYGFVSSPHWLWCHWNTWKKHLQSYWTVAKNT